MANAALSFYSFGLSFMGTANPLLFTTALPRSKENQLDRKKEAYITEPQTSTELTALPHRLHVNQEIHLNQSNPLPEYFGYVRSSHDPALLVSPLVVAGIVIGLVLFLSCVTIIIGSLKKDGGERDWRLENPSYDGISYATSSFGDLRSVCTGDISPALEFGSYLELSASYPDYPPCYEDCVGPGTFEIYLPADDPPPYSLEDPHLTQALSLGTNTEEMPLSSQTISEHLQVSSTLSTLDRRVVLPVQTMAKRSLHLPEMPIDILKDVTSPGIVLSED